MAIIYIGETKNLEKSLVEEILCKYLNIKGFVIFFDMI